MLYRITSTDSFLMSDLSCERQAEQLGSIVCMTVKQNSRQTTLCSAVIVGYVVVGNAMMKYFHFMLQK